MASAVHEARRIMDREGKPLLDATRAFAIEDRRRSSTYLFTTTALLLGALAAAGSLRAWLAALAVSVLAGLLVVRMFILYHDYLHGSILRGSRVAEMVFSLYGMLVLVPPRVWKESHNYHHAHTAKLVGSNVGSYLTVNRGMWRRMSQAQRWMYRAQRHPVTILLGYLTIFLYGTCLSSFFRAPRKQWASLLAVALHVGVSVAVFSVLGGRAYTLAVLVPMTVACALGSYLFYAQHNFEGMIIQPREEWRYTRAALRSSSYMPLGPVLAWFTGNIGFHHVHHLNPSIPFYRLPEAMAAIPELGSARRTGLGLRDVISTFRQNVWDEERGRMVRYAELDVARSPVAGDVAKT